MTANKKLFAVLFVVLGIMLFVSRSKDKENPSAELQTAKQAVKSAELATGRAESDYVTVRDKNIANEKGAAKNAVFEEDCMSIPDVVYDFCSLVDRAREHNDRIRQRKSGN